MVDVLAYRSDGDYLVTDDDTAFVFNMKTKERIAVPNVDSLFARGYWKDESKMSKLDKKLVVDAYQKAFPTKK